MNSIHRNASIILIALATLMSGGRSLAEECTDSCAMNRCAARGTCETDYQTCLTNAGGDPGLVAQCGLQQTQCYEAADSTFVACMLNCPTAESCASDAWYMNGYEISSCNEGRLFCLMDGYPEEVCNANYLACLESAQERLETRLLSRCATDCVVSLEARSWGLVKSLYRD